MALTITVATPAVKGTLDFKLENAQSTFAFTQFEIPGTLHLGTHLISVMHQFPGGTRSLQTFGVTPPKEIKWEGIIFGPNSFTRSKQLEAMVRGGLTTLTFGLHRFKGILRDVIPRILFEGYIPYEAVFEVVQNLGDDSLPHTAPQPQPISILAAVSTALGAAQTAVSNALSNPLFQTATAAVKTLQAFDPSNPSTFIATLSAQSIALFSFFSSTLVMADGVLGIALYAALNSVLGSIAFQAPVQYLYLTIDNPNLFLLAARYYGDSNKWTTISEANGNLPPLNVGLGTVTLVIPLD